MEDKEEMDLSVSCIYMIDDMCESVVWRSEMREWKKREGRRGKEEGDDMMVMVMGVRVCALLRNWTMGEVEGVIDKQRNC